MNAFYVHAALLHVLRTGGIKMNIWDLLLWCKLIDGLQIHEILNLKKEWLNYKMICHFIDAILFSIAQRHALRWVFLAHLSFSHRFGPCWLSRACVFLHDLFYRAWTLLKLSVSLDDKDLNWLSTCWRSYFTDHSCYQARDGFVIDVWRGENPSRLVIHAHLIVRGGSSVTWNGTQCGYISWTGCRQTSALTLTAKSLSMVGSPPRRCNIVQLLLLSSAESSTLNQHFVCIRIQSDR